MTTKKETFGDRIRELRDKQGLTQAGLATAASSLLKGYTITRATVSNYENVMKDIPQSTTLLLIAHALKTDPYYLLFGKDWSKVKSRKGI